MENEENKEEEKKFISIVEECEYYKTKYIKLQKEYKKIVKENKKLSEKLYKKKKKGNELDDFESFEDIEDIEDSNSYNNKLDINYKEVDIENNIIKEEKEENLTEEELLSKNFIKYGKDSLSLRKKIDINEQKINKIYNVLNKWKKNLILLKKGILNFDKSIKIFYNSLEYFNNGKNNLISDFPFLFGQISILQKCFSYIDIYCCSLITYIESSCEPQIEAIITNYFQKLEKMGTQLNNKKIEFSNTQNKYLTTKKDKKDNNELKDRYYNEYKNIEIMEYDYCSLMNQVLMEIKLKIPEIILLLTHSYVNYFSNVNKEINHLNQQVKNNLVDIFNKVKIKNKIENEINNRKNIDQTIFNYIDKTIKAKEGFLYVKDNDKDKFIKRYVIISNGKLLYYKLIKVNPKEITNNANDKIHLNILDKIDISITYEICNLLLSNVKKVDKLNSYPFCFEIYNANSQKAFTFQAETEYDMEEWINAITNVISEQIISFDKNKEKNDNFIILNDENNNDITYNIETGLNSIIHESTKLKKEEEKKNIINNLVNDNICSDCGAPKPTWISINWLTMICIECSGIHRNLGVHISKIRSLELDNIGDEYLEILCFINQREINNILEEELPLYEEEKPKYDSSRNAKEKLIINKYKEKKYINKDINMSYDIIIKNLFESIEKNDLLNIYKLIKLNLIELNKTYKIDNNEYGFIHHCIKFDMILCLKLLYIMGADFNIYDSKGQMPKNLAKNNKQNYIYEFICEKEKEKNYK